MELIQVNRAGILDAAGGIWCRTPSHPGRVLLHRMGGCLFGRVARSAVMSCGPSHRGRCSYIERAAASSVGAPAPGANCSERWDILYLYSTSQGRRYVRYQATGFMACL